MKRKIKKKMNKKLIFLVLTGLLIFVFIIGGFMLFNINSKNNKKFNIVGSWYYKKDKSMFKYEFKKDGTFTLKDKSDDIEVAGTYRFYDYDMNLFLYYDEEYKILKLQSIMNIQLLVMIQIILLLFQNNQKNIQNFTIKIVT